MNVTPMSEQAIIMIINHVQNDSTKTIKPVLILPQSETVESTEAYLLLQGLHNFMTTSIQHKSHTGHPPT